MSEEGNGKLAVTQVRSLSGRPEKHRRTMRALGFTKNQQTRPYRHAGHPGHALPGTSPGGSLRGRGVTKR
jgi:hypothetical protein